MHLTCALDDTLDVMVGDCRIGQVALMSAGWAAYAANWQGVILQNRIGTYRTIADAVKGYQTIADAVEAGVSSSTGRSDYVPDGD